MSWKVELSIDAVSCGERFMDSEEEALALVENLGLDGGFLRIDKFEKTVGKYEWICSSVNFIGTSIEVKMEIKEIV